MNSVKTLLRAEIQRMAEKALGPDWTIEAVKVSKGVSILGRGPADVVFDLKVTWPAEEVT